MSIKRMQWGIVLFGLWACGTKTDTNETGKVAKRASKSSAIAMSDDETLVAMVNPDDDSVSIFKTDDNSRVAKVTTGDEPWAVVFAADNTIYVANRAAATVVKIKDNAVVATANVGSEPTGIALSPSGKILYVAEFAESRVAAIDTATMAETSALAVHNPRALAVTNNGDNSDDDESVLVAEFYGVPTGTEASNTSRTGRVRVLTAALADSASISFAPIKTGFKAGLGNTETEDVRGTGDETTAAPNQLGAIAISNGKIFVPAVAAAPALPVRFNNNVYPIVFVADIASRTESGSINLLTGITEDTTRRAVKPTAKRLAMGDLQDIAFVGDKKIAYAVSRAADGVQRITFNDDGTAALGSTQNFQIDVAGDAAAGSGCKAPIGIVVNSTGTKGFVNCWVSRKLGVLDLGGQTLSTAVESSPFPSAGSDEERVQRGKRFYFTGRGRWSKGGEGWSSCASCHPDALSDNITWVFGTGPRQTTSQDGSFSHGKNSSGKQRVFNWTGIFDEHHDFERNTRDVSGGIGVITRAQSGKACGAASDEESIELVTVVGASGATGLIGGLALPLREFNDTAANSCKHEDWDDLDAYVKTVRPPAGLKKLDAALVAKGRTLFTGEGGCHKCHGGAGWTLSRRFFTPSGTKNTALSTTDAFVKPDAWPATWTFHTASKKIAVQPSAADPGKGDAAKGDTIAPPQVACVIRNVVTFGDDALEVRGPMGRAQGKGGYNIPSLYGLSLGAPYLHNGAAASLDELFSSSKYNTHTASAAANFAPSADDRAALVAFLLSIDAATEEVEAPAGFDGCQ